MKSIISSIPTFFMQMYLLVFTFAMSMTGLFFEVFGATEDKGAGLLCFIIFAGLFFLLIWISNRLVNVIRFENGKITRRGIFGGFYKECPINSIQKVVIKYVWREGYFIYLVDTSNNRFDSVKKDSYISFRKTKQNMAFLHSFWSGVIEE